MSGLSAHDSAYIHCVMTAPKSKSKARPAKAEPPPEPRALTHPEIRTIVLGIMLAMFLGALDQTIVATALPTIGRHFGDLDDLSWVVTAYLLTGTAVTPLYGKLADIHGRRVMMLTAIGIFVVGSVACALAPSMTALVLARAVQGLGGGGLMSLAQTIIADIVSPHERGRYQGYIGAVFAASSIGGPVLGGFLTEHIALVAYFLDQPAIGTGCTRHDVQRAPARAVSSAQAQARYHRRGADDVRRHRAPARAVLGRAAL